MAVLNRYIHTKVLPSSHCRLNNGYRTWGYAKVKLPLTDRKGTNLASEGDNRDDLDFSKQPEKTNNKEREESTQSKEDNTLTINETCGDQTDTHVENVEIPTTTYLQRSNRTIRKPIRYRE
ncbi:hypothetical protein GJ496_000310 [Pomphorhynchus laevis]|nr:hypothetical protein GJ496_000310 [Pomphorhynchus laevis]